MKIDATGSTIKIEMTYAEAEILADDIGDMPAKICQTKLMQFYRHIYATLRLRRRLRAAV